MAKASPEYQCHHILDSGQRCGAPHLKKKQFCFFHNKLHSTFTLPGQGHYEAPILDNYHACAIALTHVQRALAKKLITAVEAKAMTYTINSARDTLRMIEKSKPIHPNVEPTIETDYTPGMRHILWLDDEEEEKENGSRSPSSDTSQDVNGSRSPSSDVSQTTTSAATNVILSGGAAKDLCTSAPATSDSSDEQIEQYRPEEHTFAELSKKYRMNDPAIAEYFGYTTTGEKLSPRPPEPEFTQPDTRPPHPLANEIGLRPWGSRLCPGETPKWIPISMNELEKIEKAGLPELHEPHSEQQTHNARRLRISQTLPDREHGTTQELLQIIAKLDQEANELAPFIEKERQSWLLRKAEEAALDRM